MTGTPLLVVLLLQQPVTALQGTHLLGLGLGHARTGDVRAGLVHTFTHSEGATTSDFARTAILEKIEDSYDLQELREAIAQDSGKRFSIDEVLTELD